MISTASQMWELFYVMPLLIGAEIAPDDQQYQCFLLLQDVASIMCSPIIAVEQIPLLRLMIHEYLEIFKFLYPGRPLTPKLHYLLHVLTLIRRYVVGCMIAWIN